MLLAQLTDLHITHPGRLVAGKVDTRAYLQRAIRRLAAFTPRIDAVVVTGDLVDLGAREEYAALRELLAELAIPVHLVIGNHDNRDAFRSVFAFDGAFVQYAVDIGAVRLLALDTNDAGNPGGRLCEARLAWLAAELDRARGPIVIAMHHPPFATGIGFMDSCSLARDDSARFAELVRAHENVELVICGHVHRSVTVRFAGTVAMIAPSCAHQVTLDLTPDAPASFVFEPPAFVLHRWGGALVSHVVPVDAAEPHLF